MKRADHDGLSCHNQLHLLVGYQCHAANEALAGMDLTETKIQGSVVRVCVRPDANTVAARMRMQSLGDFLLLAGMASVKKPSSGRLQIKWPPMD